MIKSIHSISIIWGDYSFLFVPLFLAAIIASYWSYRRTVPDISKVLRAVLLTIRIAVLTLILLLIFNPVLKIEKQRLRLPELGILIDGSASMSLADSGEERSAVVEKLLNSDIIVSLSKSFDLQFFTFSDSLNALDKSAIDSISYAGNVTDIAGALNETGDRIDYKNGAVLLITDGIYNRGADPARASEKLAFPVFTVCLGDSTPRKDLSIAEVNSQPIVYKGDEVSVQATILGNPGITTELRLENQDGKVISAEKISFTGNTTEKRVNLKIRPDEEGVNLYRLQLSETEGESNLDNNSRHFTMNVLPNRKRVSVFAGAPTPDLVFLKRIFDRDPSIESKIYIEKSKGQYYENNRPGDLKECDVIVLLNYPTHTSSTDDLKKILEAVRGGKSIVIIPGWSFESKRLSETGNILPVEFGLKPVEDSPVKVIPNEEVSPLTNFFSESYKTFELPPLRVFPKFVRALSTASVSARMDSGEPAICFQTVGGVKSIVFAVHDLWRLSLQSPEYAEVDSMISGFWYKAITWLSTRSEEDLLQASTNGGSIFSSGSHIPFTARLYDQSYRPVNGAELWLEVDGPAGTLKERFAVSGDGEYNFRSRFSTEGNYSYKVTAVTGSDTLETTGQFTVEKYNPEFIDPTARPDLLRRIAEKTHGNFYFPANFSNFLEDYKPEPVKFSDTSEFKFFPGYAILAMIVLLLTCEWFIRKRTGLL